MVCREPESWHGAGGSLWGPSNYHPVLTKFYQSSTSQVLPLPLKVQEGQASQCR